MNPFKRLISRINDPEIPLHDRMFLLVSIITTIAIFIVFLGDVITGEDKREILILGGTLIVQPLITTLAIHYKHINAGALIQGICITFIIMPATFFFGGGIYGGSIIWLCFCYLFIGLVLQGAVRLVMILLITAVGIAEFALGYFHPELVVAKHSECMFFLDTLISFLVVGFMTYILVAFLTKLYLAENKRAKDEAAKVEEMNKAQSRFFSNMSHEIRTPINTIIGLDEMILREDIPDEVVEDAKNIQSAGRMLLTLINDILDMSKIESGKMEVVPVPYDLGNMLSEIVNMIWSRAHEKGLEFQVDVDPDTPSALFGDEVRIKQILINLLNNAVKYTKEGSVTLSITSARLENNSVAVTYTVEDTGIGIRKESIPHLFEAFKRVDAENNRYIEGTGLGLSIVKQLVDLMGGEISVNSIYTKGSTFMVTLEQEVMDDKAIGHLNPETWRILSAREHYHQSFEAPGAKVLVVDDNTANLMVCEKLLRATRVQVVKAGSGEEALKQTLKDHFDVILMDHLMPEMDGIECMHAIREQTGGLCRNTPIVVVTANAGSENQKIYQKEGFDGYLVKPVTGTLIEAALLKVLPRDQVHLNNMTEEEFEKNTVLRETRHKMPIMITTDSVSDLPEELIKRMHIMVLPYHVHTAKGSFLDGIEAESDAVLSYMASEDAQARSECPTVSEYENFFAQCLSRAQNIVHIAMGRKSSEGYHNAVEAAVSFYNVTVVDSGHLSSGMGLMAMYAKEAADSVQSVDDELIAMIENKKQQIETSFIVDTTEYLKRGGRVSETLNKFCTVFMLHPVFVMRDSRLKTGNIFFGTRDAVRRGYIHWALRHELDIDDSVLFITYVGMKEGELKQIEEEVNSLIRFKKIWFKKASPAVGINCGPGTFGLIFMRK